MGTQQTTRERLEKVAQLMQRDISLMEAGDLLREAGELIELPWCGCIDDVSGNALAEGTNARRMSEDFGWPKWLMEKWSSRAYARQHPIYLYCRLENSVFCVETESLWDSMKPLTPAQKQMRADTQKLEVFGNVIAPIHFSLGRTAAVVWSTQKEVDVENVVASYAGPLHSIAYRFMSILIPQEPYYADLRKTAYLTDRQIDCLSWLARGKTMAETATILDISVHTIREHLRDITDRLNAANMTHAVAIACQLGIVKPLLKEPEKGYSTNQPPSTGR